MKNINNPVYINSQKVLEALDPLNDKPYASGIRTDVTNLMQMAQHVYDIKDQLSQLPETGMSYQKVILTFSDGKVLDNIYISNGKYFSTIKIKGECYLNQQLTGTRYQKSGKSFKVKKDLPKNSVINDEILIDQKLIFN
jgi:hypothetical protein